MLLHCSSSCSDAAWLRVLSLGPQTSEPGVYVLFFRKHLCMCVCVCFMGGIFSLKGSMLSLELVRNHLN